MIINTGDLYVIINYDYFGSPSTPDDIYTTREEADKAVTERRKIPGVSVISYIVMTLEDYLYEIQSESRRP